MKFLVNKLKQAYHLFPTPPSTNYVSTPYKINPYAMLPSDPVIFDLGSKVARACYAFGNPPPNAKIVCLDIEYSPGVDLVADAHNLNMVKDNSVDCVSCIGVLLHCRYPNQVIKEIYRILKPGGIVCIAVPFTFPFCPDPTDFYRWSMDGIKILCEKFECLDSGSKRGPASTTQHILIHFLAIALCFNSRTLYGINVDLFSWLFFWVKYLDKFISKYEVAHIIHGGAYFMGKK